MQARVVVFTLLLLSLVGFSRLEAQIFPFHVSWDTGQVPLPRVQTFDDTVRYTLTLNNLSAVAFQDTIDFHLRTTTGTGIIATFDSVSIPAFGSLEFTFLDSTLNTRYGGGINVVVVWPTSSTQIDTDSLVDTLIINTVGVLPPHDKALLDVYPVPTTENVYLRMREQGVFVRRTELVDLTGRVIQSFLGLPPVIPLSDYPKGLYFIRTEDESGQHSTFKVVKQ